MSDSMSYKDYIGSVRYSEEDEVFHGKIEANKRPHHVSRNER